MNVIEAQLIWRRIQRAEVESDPEVRGKVNVPNDLLTRRRDDLPPGQRRAHWTVEAQSPACISGRRSGDEFRANTATIAAVLVAIFRDVIRRFQKSDHLDLVGHDVILAQVGVNGDGPEFHLTTDALASLQFHLDGPRDLYEAGADRTAASHHRALRHASAHAPHLAKARGRCDEHSENRERWCSNHGWHLIALPAQSLDGRLFPLKYTKWEQVDNENVNAPLERGFDLIHKVLTTVKFAHEVSVPRVVKGMKRPGIDFSPIVNRHGESSLE